MTDDAVLECLKDVEEFTLIDVFVCFLNNKVQSGK